MVFNLASGSRVTVFDVGGGSKEFTTRNADGDVVSTVILGAAYANRTVADLEANAR
ncbi:hypothetical protein [Streptomyces cylindrosporus]|uniref:Uncharacterized protein n=1 Tax=Streptomyces cylindrosporus TaxID=2927583 RepID=A0ABS9Y1E3_9ACTN|nr:hypothetical protein [Streptomyces cylindrosporus]MCI3271041.1 hypothetical protein [Streptomyces cylindrosporus]